MTPHRKQRGWTPEVARLLERGDPARDAEAEARRDLDALRPAVLAEAAGKRTLSPFPWLVPLASVLVLAVGGIVLRHELDSTKPDEAPAPTTAALEPARSEASAGRQILFSTPGGTRLVWVLAPNDPF